MERKYKCLDLFCGGGGAAKGYHDAGFEVIGVDIAERNYPYMFIQADVMEILEDEDFVKEFDFIHASPPCQAYSRLKNLYANKAVWEARHPDLIAPVREKLKYYNEKYGIHYILENVENAPLINPIKLYGSQFPNMFTQRPRLFESNLNLKTPDVPKRNMQTGPLNTIGPTGTVSICGNQPLKGLTLEQTRLYYAIAIGGDCSWMTLEELTQCIPPCYTKHLGLQVIDYLNGNNHLNEEQNFNMDEFVLLVKKYLKDEWD